MEWAPIQKLYASTDQLLLLKGFQIKNPQKAMFAIGTLKNGTIITPKNKMDRITHYILLKK
jgi:hypothetical protein